MFAHPGIKRDIDLEALFDYLYFHMIPSPGALDRDVEEILLGQAVVYRDGRVSRHFYRQAPYTENPGRCRREL